MGVFRFSVLDDGERRLRDDVRTFLAADLPRGSYAPGLGIAAAKDPEFSARLGARGWLGMALPQAYGGHDRSAVDRFVVTEELLRWGAPIGHHWVADRQTGPMLAAHGTEEQKRRFLPDIAAGAICFCIGMSEPDSGSDLASLVTRAARTEGGWRLTGTKIWTTWGDRADWIVVLCRTTPVDEAGDKRAGLTQLLVDLTAPGVTRTPIEFLDGTAEFAEIVFDDVFVPDAMVLGTPGEGWAQNTSELAYERGGPDRWLSPYVALEELVRAWDEGERHPDDAELEFVGATTASLRTFHHLTLAVARAVDRGESPVGEAALLKEMATRFEQRMVRDLLELVDHEPATVGSVFDEVLATAAVTAPSFTIRGGTSEVLRSVVAKGLRPGGPVPPAWFDPEGVDPVLVETVDRLFRDRVTTEVVERVAGTGWDADLWGAVAAVGLPWISIDADRGGSGGTVADQLAVLRLAGRHAAPAPLAETALLGGWLLAAAGHPVPAGPIGVVADPDALRIEDGRLVGAGPVGWAENVERIAALVPDGDGWAVASLDPDDVAITARRNMADEPRPLVEVDLPVPAAGLLPAPAGLDGDALLVRGSLARLTTAAGALETVAARTIAYAHEREQFGRPVAAFQAVQEHLVRVAQCAARAAMAADAAGHAAMSAASHDDRDLALEVAMARCVVDDATGEAVAAAHQAHGAIGLTREYGLQQWTRRLLAWRHEFGTTRSWRRRVGREVAARGSGMLFPTIAR